MIPIVVMTFLGLATGIAVTYKSYDDVSSLGGVVGLVVGAILGVLIALWIGGSLLPYQTVTQTQKLVMVQDSQGIHKGFYLSSSVEKTSGSNYVTVYYYHYEVAGGYNPGHLNSDDGTVTVQQNPENTEATLTTTQTFWAEGWFWLLGIENRHHQSDFKLPQNSYQPGDQISTGN